MAATSDMYTKYDIDGIIKFIHSISAKKVALQFPDCLLHDSPFVVFTLKKALLSSPPLPSPLSKSSTDGCAPSGAPCACHTPSPLPSAPSADGDIVLAILGDTSFGECCIDEVSAAHLSADCVIHFGHACMSHTTTLPAYYVFIPENIEADSVAQGILQELKGLESPHRMFLTWEPNFMHSIPKILTSLADKAREEGMDGLLAPATTMDAAAEPTTSTRGSTVTFASPIVNLCVPSFSWVQTGKADAASSDEPAGLKICGLHFASQPAPGDIVFDIGHRINRTRMLAMRFGTTQVRQYAPNEDGVGAVSALQSRKLLTSAYMHVEAIRNANIIGIVAGTLGVARHVEVVEKLKTAITAAGKHPYVLMVGKLSAVKLGNFPEIDCFVLISCPENSVLDSDAVRQFVKPLVTPEEAFIGLDTGLDWTGESHFTFEEFLKDVKIEARFSSERAAGSTQEGETGAMDGTEAFSMADLNMAEALNEQGTAPTPSAMVLRAQESALSTGAFHSAASTFAKEKRTWLGLEYETGAADGAASTKIVEGRRGIAASYAQEKS